VRKLSGLFAGLQHDMTLIPMAKSTPTLLSLGCVFVSLHLLVQSAGAQTLAENLVITPAQQATADSVAQSGVALSDLADGAPDTYTVKSGDTLWAISVLYLKSPWRWPELWGMNMQEVKNPHRIYPGQVLVLERSGDRASLHVRSAATGQSADAMPAVTDTVRISPKARITSLLANALPTLKPGVIGPFLEAPIIVDAEAFDRAPHVVAGEHARVLLAAGDKIYARGPADAPLLDNQRQEQQFRIYGEATPLTDPDTHKILGYEAKYKGSATLVKSEERNKVPNEDGKMVEEIVSASLRLDSSRQEVVAGDRLLSGIRQESNSYTPHAANAGVSSRVLSLYTAETTTIVGQNQVIGLRGGKSEGLEVGSVLAVVNNKYPVPLNGHPADLGTQLPEERIALVMVFLTFEHLSYGLIVEATGPVKVGDRLIAP